MKISKLLVLSALWLFGLGANAADLVERTAPEEPGDAVVDVAAVNRTAADFVVGNAYVLYNKGAEKFYYQGSAWGTQATGSADQALLVRFVMPSGKTLGDKALWLRNYVQTQSRWRTAFITTSDGKVGGAFGSGTAALFVDNNDGDAALLWVESVGNKTYRLSISELNSAAKPEGKFMGIDVNSPAVDAGELGTAIMPKLAEGDGVNLEWEFYEIPDWTAYYQQVDIYELAETLKSTIETAEAQGIDVSAAVAVYNNLNATLEQIQTAIDALKATMSDQISKGTAENPTDATSKINNPDFDNASAAGWSGTAPGMSGDGNHAAANVAEHYNKTFNTWQDIDGLPNGVYAMNVKTFFRGTYDDLVNNTNKVAYVYATTAEADSMKTFFCNAYSPLNTESFVEKYGSTTYFNTPNAEGNTNVGGVTYYIPNNPSTFRLYCEEEGKGYYETTLFFDVNEGKARIGVKKDMNVPGSTTDWAVFDNFRLRYFGNTAESYQKWVEQMAPVFADETVCTKSYMEAFQQAVDAQKATNKAEVVAALAAIEEAAAPLRENIALWNTYSTLSDSCLLMGNNPAYEHLDEIWDMMEYQEESYEPNLEELALTNEELLAEIAKFRELIALTQDAIKNDVQPGENCTEKYLVNADFANGRSGWQGTESVTDFACGEVEAYEKNPFDLYQVVKSPKPGVYSISLQGFFRLGSNEAAYAAWKAAQASGNPLSPVAWVYLNSNQTALNNVFDIQNDPEAVNYISGSGADPESPAASFYHTSYGPSAYVATDDLGNTWSFPNGMGNAADCFEVGFYKQAAYGLIRKGEDMRIGIKGALGGSQWALWDNFELTYLGYEAQYVLPVLEEVLATIDDSRPMGKNVYEKVVAVKAAAEAAIAAGDGEAMFNALSDVLSLNEEIEVSVALFAKLSAAVESLTEVATTEVVNQKYRNEAMALAAEIDNMIAEHQLADEDVDAQLARIAEMKVKLRLPDNYDTANDNAPVEVSRVLGNTSYDDNSTADWSIVFTDGSNSNVSNEVAESFGVNFDYFQELTGLPVGTYQLTVQGFYRAGSPVEDFARVDSLEYSHAFLYATNGEGTTFSAPIARLASVVAEAEDHTLPDGYAWVTADETELRYVANSMATANEVFNGGAYDNNSIILTVAADQKLRLGIKKTTNLANNWTIWDNWRLFYLGANSSQTPNGDPSGIETVAAGDSLTVEYFTLDGRKATAAQQGIMIQKVTLANGAVIVKKIRK